MKIGNTFSYRVSLEKLQKSNKTDAAPLLLPPSQCTHMTQMAHRMFLLEGETSAINVSRDTHTQSEERGGKEGVSVSGTVYEAGQGEGDMAVRVCAPKGPRITHMSAKC